MDSISWAIGDWVVYRKSKRSPSPGPRAQNVVPTSKGDTYTYTVDKYWIVTDVLNDGHLLVQTLRGKQHKIPHDDPQIRKPRIWERWIFNARYRDIEKSLQSVIQNNHTE